MDDREEKVRGGRVLLSQCPAGPRIIMTHFLEAVQKHTMGETGTASEIFESRNEVVKLSGINPRSTVLTSIVGPFATQKGLKIDGASAASAYCNLTLKCIYEYIDKGSIFKPVDNFSFCLMHGGLTLDHNATAIFERCVVNAMGHIEKGNEVKAIDVKSDAAFNDVHQLGFGGSVITGRLPVEEACTGGEAALQAMHPLFRTTVVGHTPQWLGIPTIIREIHQPSTNPRAKFLIALDTQYSDRQKNTHSLGLFEDGSFCLVGKWMDQIEYVARADDIHIGQKIEIQRRNGSTAAQWVHTSEVHPLDRPITYFRVIAKVTAKLNVPVENIYIAVNYQLNPQDRLAPEGLTTVSFVKFRKESEEGAFVGEVVNPDMEMTVKKGVQVLETGFVVPFVHAHLHEIDKVMESARMGRTPPTDRWDFKTFVCGDIEASVDFLHAFIVHSYEMATGQKLDTQYLSTVRADWNDVSHPIEERYGLPDDGSLGFDVRSISNKMKEIMRVSYDLLAMVDAPHSRTVTFSCIGDVIGDPIGKGNLDHVTGTELIHEFMCVHWANKFCEHKLVGNRDWNKLRLQQEIRYITEPGHVAYLKLISQHHQKLASGESSPMVKLTLQRLLGHFCYPYVTSKDAQGNPIKVNKSFVRDPEVVPYTSDAPFGVTAPVPIWEHFP